MHIEVMQKLGWGMLVVGVYEFLKWSFGTPKSKKRTLLVFIKMNDMAPERAEELKKQLADRGIDAIAVVMHPNSTGTLVTRWLDE